MRHSLSRICWRLALLAAVGCAPVDTSPEVSGERRPAAATASRPASPEAQDGDPVQQRIRAAIEHCRRRELLTTNGFWTVFHGILGLGPSLTLTDPDSGRKVNALEYISSGGELRGLRFFPTRWGLDVQMGPPFVGQGHQDQFIAEMAQWGIRPDHPFRVNGQSYTFADFVRHAQMRAKTTATDPPQELSWAIIVIAQYVGIDAEWTNEDGERLTLVDCVRYEMQQPIETAACGGTHRLFGLRWVHHLHLQRGGKTEGLWKELDDQQRKYQALARKWQNADGSFSTEFFTGPGNAQDMQRRINTSGHILEWLALSLDDQQIREPWVEQAANAVAMMFLEIQNQPMEGGSLYHAAHGLLMYYARRYDADWLGPNRPLIMLPTGPFGGPILEHQGLAQEPADSPRPARPSSGQN